MADGLDIESLGESEGALLVTVLNQTHDCIKLLSLDGTIRYVNRQGALAMELSSPRDLIGQAYVTRWPEDVRPMVEAALSAARRGELGKVQSFATGARRYAGLVGRHRQSVSAAGREITHFVTVARDMTVELLEHERVEAIGLEMRHRLKNALTVAAGIVMMNARGRPDVTAFANEIATRFSQLSEAQSLILDPGADKRLTHLIPTLLEAYGEGAGLDFGDMPAVSLSDRAMQAVALCFGELVTNSMKYGALRDGRRVRVEGHTDGSHIELHWSEPTAFGTARPGGQGLDLISRLIRTASGTIHRDVAADKMQTIIRLPAQ